MNIKLTAAHSIHEAFSVAQDDEDTSGLRDALHSLLQDESTEVQKALCLNIDVIIAKYVNAHAVAQANPETAENKEQSQQ